MAATQSIHGMWSTRLAFILAATGSAVGLGNIWRFPYTAGEYGGGAFVIVYLLCVALIGIPIMMAEIMLGRRGRQSPINTMRALARAEGQSGAWQILGWMGIVAGFLILSFYSVIAGWTMAYIFRAASGMFSAIDAAGAGAMFDGLVGDAERLLAWHTIFMVMVVLVVGNELAGFWGMLVAVPVTAVIRDVFKYLYLRLLDEPLRPEEAMARIRSGQEVQLGV